MKKLVRDKIPEIIKKSGAVPVVHSASDDEYWLKLKEKLREEISEFSKAESEEEMADILEVLYAMCNYKKFGRNRIENLRKKKAKERGGFRKRTILDIIK